MSRFLLPIIVGLAVGSGLGWIQSKSVYTGFEERFLVSTTTLAESKGELTHDEVEAQAVGTPRVEVEGGDNYEFGTMLLGDSLSHEFKFRNVGDGPLFLDMGGSTCKCTIGDLDKSVLKPGEETMVKLTWTPKAVASDFSQSATIKTTDPLKTEVQLQISGKVAESIMFEPLSLALGDISSSEDTTRVVKVYCYLKGLELTEMRWSEPTTAKLVDFAYAEFDPKLDDPNSIALKGYNVTVTFKPGLRLGQLSGRLQAVTNLREELEPIELAVIGRVSGDIEIIGGPSFDREHNILTMGTVDPAEGSVMRLQIALQGKNREAAKPTIVSVFPKEILEVEIGEPKDSATRRLYPIIFRIPKNAPEGMYAGNSSRNFAKVMLRTSEDSGEFPIYVRVNVKKPD